MLNKLIILDRDGVINEDSDDYIKSPQEWIPIASSLAAIARLKQAKYQLAIATNQSGIGRGYYDADTLHAMHEKMHKLLAPSQAHIDHIEFCPHAPDANCNCRKPKTGMLDNILEKFKMKPQNVVMVGDTISDYRAAKAAGISFILVKTGKGERTLATGQLPADIAVYDNLASYVDVLLGDTNT